MNRPLPFFHGFRRHVEDALVLLLGVALIAAILGSAVALDYGFAAAFCDRSPVYFGKQGFVCPDAFTPAVKP